MKTSSCLLRYWMGLLSALVLAVIPTGAKAQDAIGGPVPIDEIIAPTPGCTRTVTANVVALDQPFFWNRLGAAQPQGMIFALKRDVVGITANTAPSPGNAKLRNGKRPRPIALRMNVGDCLRINFQNLLSFQPVDEEQVVTRSASVHVIGMQFSHQHKR